MAKSRFNNSKYELRSPSVQELMRRMPRHFVLWGNPLILLIFILGLLSLNSIRLSQYRSVPAVVQKVAFSGGYIRLSVAAHFDQASSDPKGDTLMLLQLNEGGSSSQGGIRCRMLSTGPLGPHDRSITMVSMDTLPALVRTNVPDSGQICTIKISEGSRNIFSVVRQHFKL